MALGEHVARELADLMARLDSSADTRHLVPRLVKLEAYIAVMDQAAFRAIKALEREHSC